MSEVAWLNPCDEIDVPDALNTYVHESMMPDSARSWRRLKLLIPPCLAYRVGRL